MTAKRITFHGDNIEIEASGRNAVRISVIVDADSVLAEFDAQEIVQCADISSLLDEIGEEAVREHFGID